MEWFTENGNKRALCRYLRRDQRTRQLETSEFNISCKLLETLIRVTYSAVVKVSEQCGNAASKSNTILGPIRRTITYKEIQLIVHLYKVIVGLHVNIVHKHGGRIVRRT